MKKIIEIEEVTCDICGTVLAPQVAQSIDGKSYYFTKGNYIKFKDICDTCLPVFANKLGTLISDKDINTAIEKCKGYVKTR